MLHTIFKRCSMFTKHFHGTKQKKSVPCSMWYFCWAWVNFVKSNSHGLLLLLIWLVSSFHSFCSNPSNVLLSEDLGLLEATWLNWHFEIIDTQPLNFLGTSITFHLLLSVEICESTQEAVLKHCNLFFQVF